MNPILTVLAGSHAHGINTVTSDYDYLSIVVAPLEVTLGIAPPLKTVQQRTAPQGVRSSAGDVETTTYELRHFMQLATQGNPNILVPLFANPEHVVQATPLGMSLRALTPSIVSMQAVRRHLGYLDAQRGRITGNGPHQARKPNRPELVEVYGYDTKYAAHALRLAWQGIELAQFGRLNLPMPPFECRVLRGIRVGEWTESRVLEEIDATRAELVAFVEGRRPVALRPEPDWGAVNTWLIKAQKEQP